MHALASLYYHCTYFHGASVLGLGTLPSAAMLAVPGGSVVLAYIERRRRRTMRSGSLARPFYSAFPRAS